MNKSSGNDFIMNSTSSQWDLWNETYQSLEEGNYSITFCANDSVGEVNQKNRLLFKDTTPPVITDYSSIPIVSRYSPRFHWVIWDETTSILDIQYSIDNVTWIIIEEDILRDNLTYEENFLFWNGLLDGPMNLTLRVGDSALNYQYVSYQIVKDTTAPSLQINWGAGIFYETPPNMEINVSDYSEIEPSIYSFNPLIANYSLNGNIPQVVWDQ